MTRHFVVVALQNYCFAILTLRAGLLLLFSSTVILAQPTDFQFDRLTRKDGLSHNRVLSICQDKHGFMWFGTEDGLNRYDGRTFKIYRRIEGDSTSLFDNRVWDIHEDRSGNLWISAIVLHKYDRDHDRFTRYPLEPDSSNSPQTAVISVLPESDGTLWVTSWSGLDNFDPGTGVFTRIELGGPKIINSITDDHAGNLWLGHRGAGAIRLNKKSLKFEHYLTSERILEVLHLYQNKPLVWIGSSTGVFKIDDRRNQYVTWNRNPSDSMHIGVVFSFCEDSVGRFWCGTLNRGLKLFDRMTNSFTTLTHNSADPGSLSSSSISPNGLYVDRQGNLWIATTNGVNIKSNWRKKFRHVGHNTENPSSIVDGEVTTIIEDSRGDLWTGTWGGGLSRRDHQTGVHHNYTPKSGLIPWVSVAYEDRKGTVWIGTNQAGGLNKWDRHADTFSKDNLDVNGPRNGVEAIFEDSRSTFWLGTGDGVCMYDRVKKGKRWYTLDTSGSTSVAVIYEDRSMRLWVGCNLGKGAFYEYDRLGDRFIRRYEIPVRSIHEDQAGRLWLGTLDGLVLYDRNTDSLVSVLTASNGLGGEFVFGILEDDHGNLWLSTNKSLTKYNPDSRTVRNFGVNDGISGIIDAWVIHGWNKGKTGQMMFGDGNGYVVFHPDSIRDNPNVPPIVITDFKLSNDPVKITADSPLKKHITETKSITLSHYQNTLSFEYAALDYTAPANNQYACQLVGFEKDWVHVGTRNFAHYTSLSPGEYTFKVKGSNSDGVWNEQGTSIRITITPPWWKTKLAYAFYGIFIVSVLYSIRQFEKKRDRMKQQAELDRVESEKRLQQEFSKQLIETQEAERKRVASELHDSLGQHLLIVNNELQLYQQGKGENDPDLQRTTSIVKDAIKEVREIASNLHPHHLEKLGLRAAVEAMIEQISRSTPVTFDAAIANVDDKLSMQAKINLYRVLQEAVANIVRHSGATHAKIGISQTNDSVQTIIEDDGKGFIAGSSQGGRQGFGLKNMSERMSLVGGTITFNSTPGKGTAILIAIPIHN